MIENIHLNHCNIAITFCQTETPQTDLIKQIETVLSESFRPRKMDNLVLAEKIKTYNESKALRLLLCGKWIEFAFSNALQKKKITGASSCHVRLCPICQWKRSRSAFANLSEIYNHPNLTTKKHLLMTLTARNVSGADLEEEITRISKGFTNLMKKKEMKIFEGYTRTIEVTYSKKHKTYHPHIHAILTAPAAYGSRVYLSQDKICRLWQEQLNLDYKPVCDIRRINKKTGSIAEVAKYSIKPSDYLDQPSKVVEVLDKACDGKRFLSTGGIIKDLKKELKMTNLEEKKEDNFDLGHDWEKAIYEWHFGKEEYIRIYG